MQQRSWLRGLVVEVNYVSVTCVVVTIPFLPLEAAVVSEPPWPEQADPVALDVC